MFSTSVHVFMKCSRVRVHESKQCIPSPFMHIEPKVPSGTVLPTRANPVFKSIAY